MRINASLIYRIPALVIVGLLILIVVPCVCVAGGVHYAVTELARSLVCAMESLIHFWLWLLQ